ncbi:hypothetical protein M0R45_001640 [Rubus argutus]|uniref:Uncharacterized protein n=1 Tax=Rubus argutus TaxID=59490 RepID=A0AAW1VL42_RUBAR
MAEPKGSNGDSADVEFSEGDETYVPQSDPPRRDLPQSDPPQRDSLRCFPPSNCCHFVSGPQQPQSAFSLDGAYLSGLVEVILSEHSSSFL